LTLLVGWQEGHPSCKNRVVGCWRGYLLERGADLQLHMAQLMPLPLTVSCFSKIEIGFTFLVPAHLGSPGKRAVKRVCVCVSLSDSVVNLQQIFISVSHHTLSVLLHYLVKYLCSKNRYPQEIIEENGHIRLSHSKHFSKIFVW